MDSCLQTILACLTGREPVPEPTETNSFIDEKRTLLSRYEYGPTSDNDSLGRKPNDPEQRPVSEIADQVVHTLLTSEKVGTTSLHQTLDTIVGPNGWTEKLAKWILVKLETALKQASKLSPAVKQAYDKACEAALQIEGFVKEHPVFCTVIALGVLVLITPWVIEALGFAELGPVEGSFAAWWQSRYAGLVPKGSLFSYFQRLGMTWRRVALGGKRS